MTEWTEDSLYNEMGTDVTYLRLLDTGTVNGYKRYLRHPTVLNNLKRVIAEFEATGYVPPVKQTDTQPDTGYTNPKYLAKLTSSADASAAERAIQDKVRMLDEQRRLTGATQG